MRHLNPCLRALVMGIVLADLSARAAYPERPIHVVVPFG